MGKKSSRRSRRPPIIAPRTPVFIGCEGRSERAYVKRIGEILENRQPQRYHFNTPCLRGGDPLSMVRNAKKELDNLLIEKENRFVLIDRDVIDRYKGDTKFENDMREAIALAKKHHIRIIWQTPCFEAFLLRHLEPQGDLTLFMQEGDTFPCPDKVNTLTSGEAKKSLEKKWQKWPGYEKPMSSQQLEHIIDCEAVERAARCEPVLRKLLRCIDWDIPGSVAK